MNANFTFSCIWSFWFLSFPCLLIDQSLNHQFCQSFYENIVLNSVTHPIKLLFLTAPHSVPYSMADLIAIIKNAPSILVAKWKMNHWPWIPGDIFLTLYTKRWNYTSILRKSGRGELSLMVTRHAQKRCQKITLQMKWPTILQLQEFQLTSPSIKKYKYTPLRDKSTCTITYKFTFHYSEKC